MLSRVADSVYWMNRYMERAENVARFVDVNLQLLLDLPPGGEEQWEPLVDVTGDEPLFASRYGAAGRESVLKFLTFDETYPNSIFSCLHAARENARSVREIISSEMWERVNTAYLMVAAAARDEVALADPHDFYSRVKAAAHHFVGVMETTMSHGEAWHFCRVGRFIERADKTTRLLDVKYFILLPETADVGSPVDAIQWAAVLRSASGFEMYRKRYHGISPDLIAEFLLLDREFPRAVQYCLSAADYSLHAISRTPVGGFSNEAERQLGQLRAELSYERIERIMSGGLHEFLDALQEKLNHVGDSIRNTFFS